MLEQNYAQAEENSTETAAGPDFPRQRQVQMQISELTTQHFLLNVAFNVFYRFSAERFCWVKKVGDTILKGGGWEERSSEEYSSIIAVLLNIL